MNAANATQLTPAKALEIAKNCEDGSVPPAVTAVLEKAIGELWQRIQYQPSTYVMNKEEFIVFNYYRSRFANVPMAQQAVARFWNNFQGNSTEVFTDACNENPQNDFNQCFNSLYVSDFCSVQATGRCANGTKGVLRSRHGSEHMCALLHLIQRLSGRQWVLGECVFRLEGRLCVLFQLHVSGFSCPNRKTPSDASCFRVQAYAYCGCWFALPEQLYNCANVELQVHGVTEFDPAPTASIVSSALLAGPVAPPSATLTNIPASVPSNAPLFSPRQSSTLVPTIVLSTSTVVTTSCNSDISNCPATAAVVYSSTSAVASVYTIPPSSLPRAPEPVGAVPAAAGGGSQQSTSSVTTTVPVTRTATITGPAGSLSESVYTTSTVSTILSCDGGCISGPAKVGECVVRKRTRVVTHEEI
ncbi:MAG: hypothetical protein Q9218_000173 [Villophora microphyllina]